MTGPADSDRPENRAAGPDRSKKAPASSSRSAQTPTGADRPPKPKARPPRKPAAVETRSEPSDYLRLLIAPPRDVDVLIADERVLYRAPKHVFSLVEPLAETVAVLVLVTVILTRPDYDGITLGLLAVVLSGIVFWRWFKQREWGWSALGAAIVAAYVIVTRNLDYVTVTMLIGLWFIGRLGIKILRWWRYEVRYLTNRRIIEATGFFGLRVASMPVSRVTDLVLDRTTFGEIFGYGNLHIESAGQDQALAWIPFLVEPRAFHRLAVRLATKPADINPKDFIDVRPVRQIEKR